MKSLCTASPADGLCFFLLTHPPLSRSVVARSQSATFRRSGAAVQQCNGMPYRIASGNGKSLLWHALERAVDDETNQASARLWIINPGPTLFISRKSGDVDPTNHPYDTVLSFPSFPYLPLPYPPVLQSKAYPTVLLIVAPLPGSNILYPFAGLR